MPEDHEEIRRLYEEWSAERDDYRAAISRMTKACSKLRELGVDPYNPPEWLLEDKR
jgi:hypothetical protein